MAEIRQNKTSLSQIISPVPDKEQLYISNTRTMSSEWFRWLDSLRQAIQKLRDEQPKIQTFIAQSGQSAFTTNSKTIENETRVNINGVPVTRVNLEVYVNGLYQSEGETLNYQITGSNEITFTESVSQGAVVVVKSYK